MEQMEQYHKWILENVPNYESAYGKCAEVTTEMLKAFPELKRVRGHYYCVSWGKRAHWWLVAPDGSVVDPTATQFPTKGRGVYIEHDESQPEPERQSLCANCGEYFSGSGTVCSDKCHREYAAYCMSFR